MVLAKRHRVLPGFGLSMGCTLAYVGLIVLLPLAALAIECCRRTTPGTLTYTSGSSSFCIGVGSGEVQVGEKLPMSV